MEELRSTSMAKRRQIMITHTDRQRLGSLIQNLEKVGYVERRYIDDLRDELERAEAVDSHEVLADVITMNSTARLRDLETGDTFDCTLVYPGEANADEDKVSILAPVGTALLGYRVGDEIEWPIPAGVIRLKVEEVVYQPERAGEYER